MKIGLLDIDGHNFPNLALMKISAYHKPIADNVEWLITMYKGILNMVVDVSDSGLQHWVQKLKDGMPRKNIEDYFRQVAHL